MVSLFPRRPAAPSESGVLARAKTLLDVRAAERDDLDEIHRYWRGRQPHPFRPVGSPPDVTRLAKMSRINIIDIAISAVSQTLYVDGYRQERADDDAPGWEIWQANRMDAEQSGIHDAALVYGSSYVTVLPGDPRPAIRGYSPRFMTVLYGDDPDWPVMGLAAEPNGSRWLYRLIDDQHVHFIEGDAEGGGLTFIESREHAEGVTPIVRYRNRIDLDGDNLGEVEPLYEIQDQIDHTTFNLKVAEHFGAFKQRAVIGWTASSEDELLKASAQRIWSFEDDDVKFHEFNETDLAGYLAARESEIRYASVTSQVPPHYLLGQLANLSAEALVAAESSLMRKSRQRQKSFGESHEQTLALAGRVSGLDATEGAQVRWADPESRAFAATVDALTKLHTMGVPIELLLERIPGFTQQDVETAKSLLASGDSLDVLADLLRQQAGGFEDEDTGEAA
ncbi:MAG: phage portal protein [Dehalococcoidia bacterium]|nr:phage portal protein [Dehalococcoidia bacterium]